MRAIRQRSWASGNPAVDAEACTRFLAACRHGDRPGPRLRVIHVDDVPVTRIVSAGRSARADDARPTSRKTSCCRTTFGSAAPGGRVRLRGVGPGDRFIGGRRFFAEEIQRTTESKLEALMSASAGQRVGFVLREHA